MTPTTVLVRLLCSLYFLLFIAFGANFPFTSIFLKRILVDQNGEPAIGLIGTIYAVLPFVGLVSNMVASIIADRLHIGRRIIALNSLLAALAAVAIAQSAEAWSATWSLQTRFLAILGGMLFLSFCNAPIQGLLDAETMHHLNARSQRERYGNFRLWGTYGWSVATITIGALVTLSGHIALLYYATALGYLLMALVAWRSVSHTPLEKPPAIAVKQIFRNRPFMVFFVMMLLYGTTYYASTVYLGYFFDSVMKSMWEIGLIFGTWTIFEIPIMLFSHRLIRRFGNRTLLCTGIIFNAARLLLFATFTPATPFAVKFAVALLQGPAFALTHLGIIDYVDSHAHAGLRATYLNTISIAQNTIGASLGGILGSWVIGIWGSGAVLHFSGIGVLILLLPMWLTLRPAPNKGHL